MVLPEGLVPVLAFVLTAGISIPVALVSHLFYRIGNGTFGATLRGVLLGAGGLYLVGTLVVWAFAGGPGLWEIPFTLLVTGVLASIVLTVVPLAVGRRIIQHFSAVDRDTALRFATYGWPVAMLAVFGIYVAPGGAVSGDILSLGGERICLAGFCGISIPLLGAVILEVVVAVLAPGIVGTALYSSAARTRGYQVNP